MWNFLLVSSLLAAPPQDFSGRLGPGFVDAGLVGEVVFTELGDVDGDGRVDACFWTAAGDFGVQRNAGFGRFEALSVSLPPASLGQEFTRFALGELDGDGLLDLVVAREAGPGLSGPGVTEVLLGDGAGGFTLAVAFSNDFPFNRAADDLELIDLDGDGRLDVIQSSYGIVRAHRNLGAGQFNAAGAVLFAEPSNRSITLAPFDFRGDGDLDFAAAVNGAPGFVLEQLTPTTFSPAAGFGDVDGSPLVGDLNGDGLADLVVAELFANFTPPTQVRVYRQAPGGLQLAQAFDLPVTTELSGLADLDGDGRPDLLLGSAIQGAALRLPGLAGAQFDPLGGTTLEDGGAPAQDLDFADLDLDGDLDVVARSVEFGVRAPRLFFGRGDGSLARIGVGDELALQDRRALVDMDQDGDLDVVQLGALNAPSFAASTGRLFRNDGLGVLVGEERPDYVFSRTFNAFDLGDLDGDGDVDVLVGAVEFGGPFGAELGAAENFVVLNDGSGGLQEAPGLDLTTPDYSAFVLLFDAEGDGDADAFLGNLGPEPLAAGENRLVLNDGSAGFADATGQLPTLRGSSTGGAAADFDADGDLDLLVGDSSLGLFGGLVATQPRFWLNNGAGVFSDASAQLPVAPVLLGEILLADLDGDGDQDAWLACLPDSFGIAEDRLLVNDGSAGFSLGATPAGVETLSRPVFSDVDLDGDPDLVRYVDDQLVVFRNAGGQLGSLEVLGGPAIAAGGDLAAVDLDNDGDEDLIVGRTLVRSLATEVWAATPTSVGKEFLFELRAPGPGSSYLLAYSTGLISLPLPGLGLLRLDPTASFGVLGTGLLDAQGAAQALGAVPNSPGLVGATVVVQALLGAPARLSRAFETTLTSL